MFWLFKDLSAVFMKSQKKDKRRIWKVVGIAKTSSV